MNNLTKWLTGAFVALAGSGIIVYSYSGLNGNNEMISFSINNAEAVINQTSGEIDVTLPSGTVLTNLTPTFAATGPNVTVRGKASYSGISSYNFESNVPYVVHASNGDTKNYFAHIITGTPTESYSYFQFFSVDSNTNGGLSNGVITGNNIAVTVPYNTVESNLVSYFNYVGTSVKVNGIKQISNVTANSFISPVTYNVHGEDGTNNPYTITVSKAAASDKTITSFDVVTFYGIYPGYINGTNIHVGIPTQVNPRNLIAEYSSTGSLVKVGSTIESSGLTVNNFESPVIYNVTSGDGLTNQNYTVTVDNYYTFLDVHNLSETIFDNKNYNVSFIVTNNESSTLNNVTATFATESPVSWTLSGDTCTGNNILVNESCVVSGTLSISKRYGRGVVAFTLKDGSSITHATYNKIVTAIPQLTELSPGIESPSIYAAYRFTNVGAHRMFTTSSVNGKNICFDANHIGTITNAIESWATCAVEMTRNNDTLYIPAFPAVGGKTLISMDNKIPDGPSPSVTATNPVDTYFTRWQQVEYGGGLTSNSSPALFNLNPTNVNFVSIPTTVSTVISGVIGPYNNNSYAAQGILFGRNIKTESVLAAMESGLAHVPNSNNPSWNGLTQPNAQNNLVLRILAPATIFPFMGTPSSQFYFNGAFFSQYINDLWAYYTDNAGGHFLYVDDSPAASIITPGSTCILKCQVTHADDLMHCAYDSGTCPTNALSGTLDGAYTNVGGFSSPAGFTKFTAVDFISAAGTSAVTTFGANGTYRSLTGENIVSAQSVGFLPYCTNPLFVFGNPQFVASQNTFYTPQYNCLANYASYTTSVIDQYSYQSSLYFGFYNYGYSDTLGQSGAVYSLSAESYPFTIDVN
jgi:hypothetical protein